MRINLWNNDPIWYKTINSADHFYLITPCLAYHPVLTSQLKPYEYSTTPYPYTKPYYSMQNYSLILFVCTCVMPFFSFFKI